MIALPFGSSPPWKMPLALRSFATEKSISWIRGHEIPWDERVVDRAT